MAHELQLIKHSSGILIPATPETSDLLQSKIKLGSVLVAEFRQVRNPAFHRRFFALLNLGFEYWEPTGGAISSNERKLVNAIERDKALAWVDRNIKVPLTEPQKAGIASFCPYNIGPGKCFPSTFYKRINAGDTKGACEAIRWWIKDGGRDCRLTKGQKDGCYGQVERRDQESALTCWGIDQ